MSAAINAAISAGFMLALFGSDMVPVWGVPGLVADFLPQGFMVGLMASLVPGLLANRAIARDAVSRPTVSFSGIRIVLLSLTTALVSAIAGTALMFAVFAMAGVTTLLFLPAFSLKVFFGGMLGAGVTVTTLRRLLA